jgi:ubiquinone/menaquinone biosynthesis C-methylase UbiE
MTKQSKIVAESEGNAWWARNWNRLNKPSDDMVLEIIKKNNLTPTNVCEVGCANGWRLSEIKRIYKAKCRGYDLSKDALEEGHEAYPHLALIQGGADNLHFSQDNMHDLLIYGFVLYLCDREDLFKIAAEGDRVLKDGGHLIVFDFLAERPHSVAYGHDPRLKTYKMNHARLWSSNPAYRVVDCAVGPDQDHVVWLLKKDLSVWQRGEE